MNAEILKGDGEKVIGTCAFCQGKGIDPFELLSKQSICQVCSGGGQVTVHGPVRACAYCNGTGVHLQRRLVCTVCGGKGMVSIKEPMETCPGCRGRGLIPGQYLPCLTCRGKGVLKVSGKQKAESGQEIGGMQRILPTAYCPLPTAIYSKGGLYADK